MKTFRVLPNKIIINIMVTNSCSHLSQHKKLQIRKHSSVSKHWTKQPSKQSKVWRHNREKFDGGCETDSSAQIYCCCRGWAVVQSAVSWKMLNLWNPVVFCRISGRVFLHFYRTTSVSCWVFCGAQAANSFNRYRIATLFSSNTLYRSSQNSHKLDSWRASSV